MTNAIITVLEDAAKKVEQAVENAGKTVAKHFHDTADRLGQSVRAHVEHDGNAAHELEPAGRHADETPTVHGGGSETTPAAAGPTSSGAGAGGEVNDLDAYGQRVEQGYQRHASDPATASQFPPGYDPLHGQTVEEYVAQHSNGTFTEYGHPRWNWDEEAPNEGFLPDTREPGGPPVETYVDRYGGSHGHYLSPDGTAYPQRGLPIENLTDDYHRYRVLQPFPEGSEKGVIAPAFDEPGMGIQYYHPEHSVAWLEKNGYIEEVK